VVDKGNKIEPGGIAALTQTPVPASVSGNNKDAFAHTESSPAVRIAAPPLPAPVANNSGNAVAAPVVSSRVRDPMMDPMARLARTDPAEYQYQMAGQAYNAAITAQAQQRALAGDFTPTPSFGELYPTRTQWQRNQPVSQTPAPQAASQPPQYNNPFSFAPQAQSQFTTPFSFAPQQSQYFGGGPFILPPQYYNMGPMGPSAPQQSQAQFTTPFSFAPQQPQQALPQNYGYGTQQRGMGFSNPFSFSQQPQWGAPSAQSGKGGQNTGTPSFRW